jgi:threonine/homoserine/homoserine lactone efflux protein
VSFFFIWALWAVIQLGATVSPGPAFIIGIRNAIIHGKGVGIATGLGLGSGVAVHIFIVFTGIAVLITQSEFLYNAIKYAGAAYLAYIGMKCLYSSYVGFNESSKTGVKIQTQGVLREKTYGQAFVEGFATNVLNPKAILFFSAVFSQFITVNTSVFMMGALGVTSVTIEAGWYILVSVLLTNRNIQSRFLSITHWIDLLFGVLILFLALQLVFHSITFSGVEG